MANKTWSATGRRKRAVANVIITSGTGNITVNGRDVNEYMPDGILVLDLKQPLTLTNNENRFDITVSVKGGGYAGQAGAIRLGIARCLLKFDENNTDPENSYRHILKTSHMVTRDARVKERKKYGLKKARRAPQFSKR